MSEPEASATEQDSPRSSRREKERSARRSYREKQTVTARILGGTLLANWLVAGVKLALGYLSGSVGLIASGYNALVDGVSNLAGIAGVTVARKPPDDDHPYGHHKIEAFAALVIAFFLFLAAWQVIERTVASILNPQPIDTDPLYLWIVGVSAVFSGLVAWFEHHWAGRLDSPSLDADARYSAADALTTLTVLGALIGVRAGAQWLDWFVSIVVLLVILRSGWDILLESFRTLTDVQRIDPAQVRHLAKQYDLVGEVHKVRSRGTPNAVQLDLHVQLPPYLSNEEAHDIGHEIKDELMDKFPELTDVTVHTEPLPRVH